MSGSSSGPSAVDLLLHGLTLHGVTHVFGVPGGPLLPFYQALAQQQAIRSVLTKHETGAAFQALGHAQAGRGLPVVCTTTGPGATNALTGVASATSDSVPMLLLTAQISTVSFGRGGLQDSSGGNWGIDTVDMFRSATKLSAMVTHPGQLPRLLRHAIRTARQGRPGAVHLSIPADVMTAPVPGSDPQATAGPVSTAVPVADPTAVAEVAALLQRTDRPVVLAGQGARLAGARASLVRLAERLQLPVATTMKGKSSFPEDHPLSLGVFGFGGHPFAHEYLLSPELDLVLVLGSGLGELATHGWDPRLFAGRHVVQIDLDPLQVGRCHPVDTAVVGDARAVVDELVAHLPAAPARPTDPVRQRVLDRCPRYYQATDLHAQHPRLRASTLVARLSERLPAESLLFLDNGHCLSWVGQYFTSRVPGETFASLNVGAMGYATGAAIGGKLARPDRPVVTVVGDAAFAMNGFEVHTAAEYGVPVVVVVLNNGGHAMVHHVQELVYENSYDSMFRHPLDVAGVARGLGAQVAQITDLVELDAALANALVADGPFVIDAHVGAEEVPWALAGRVETLRDSFSVERRSHAAADSECG